MKKRSRIEILTFHPDLKGLFLAKKEQARLDRLAKRLSNNIVIDGDVSENILFENELTGISME